MTTGKMNKIILLFLLIPLFPRAQQFRHYALIDTVRSAGFYRINISPEISGYLKTDLSDLRVADDKGNWVPHIIYDQESKSKTQIVVTELPVISKENSSTFTTIVVSNKNAETLSNVELIIKNSAVSRFASISGSDDQKSWYSIADSVFLDTPEPAGQDKSSLFIYFKPVRYAYYKVSINNGKNDPLNIITVQYRHSAMGTTSPVSVLNPGLKTIHRDSASYSLIILENPQSYHISKVNLEIKWPLYYNRAIKVYVKDAGSIGDFIKSVPFSETMIKTGSENAIAVSPVINSSVYLLLENRDNPPLELSGITTAQNVKQVVAYLEQGRQYRLLLNDPKATSPDYDLNAFSNKLPDSIPVLNTRPVAKSSTLTATQDVSFFKKWFIWPVIIAVLILLFWLTRGLVADLKNKE